MFAQVLLAGRKTWKVLKISFWVLDCILILGTAILVCGYGPGAIAGPAAVHEDGDGLPG